MSTQHFTDESLCSVGPHADIDNTPDAEITKNLQLVEAKLEEARRILSEHYGVEVPIFTKYGYRCPALNKAVGSVAKRSAHLEGLAADTHYKDLDPDEVAHVLFQHPTFMEGIDQLITERGCLHFGLPCAASGYMPRHELRRENVTNGVLSYPLVSIWKGARP